MKAMKTPVAKAKGMKPETKTMKVMKTPAAKAKGMKPKTEPLAGMESPAAKAKQMKPPSRHPHDDGAVRRPRKRLWTQGVLRLRNIPPYWRRLQPLPRDESVDSMDAVGAADPQPVRIHGAGQRNQNAKRKRFQDTRRHGLASASGGIVVPA